MCDYSLLHVRSRPAKVGDKLTTRDFGTGTRGFAGAEDNAVAVCVLPGTELAFSSAVTVTESRFVVGWKAETLGYATAIFRQVNKKEQFTHHDAGISGWAHCSPDTTVWRSGSNGTPVACPANDNGGSRRPETPRQHKLTRCWRRTVGRTRDGGPRIRAT
jgi:hypothetical protein